MQQHTYKNAHQLIPIPITTSAFPSSIIKDGFSASTAKSFVLTQLCQPRIKVPRFSVFFVHIVSGCVCCLCALVCLCVRESVWEKERNREPERGEVLCVSIIYEYSIYHNSTLSMSNHVEHPHVAACFLELQKFSMVMQSCNWKDDCWGIYTCSKSERGYNSNDVSALTSGPDREDCIDIDGTPSRFSRSVDIQARPPTTSPHP